MRHVNYLNLNHLDLNELLEAATTRWPQKSAFIEDNSSISYGQLTKQIESLASQFKNLHLPRGARVGLCFPNSVNYVALTFALWRNHAVVVPIPTECSEPEISQIATTMGLEIILSHKNRMQSVCLGNEIFLTQLNLAKLPDNHGLNLAFIRFTSGTTSASKGVALSHETIRDRIMVANEVLKINEDDTVIWCLPMSHHFLVTILLYLANGATIVLARHLLSRTFLEAINRWKGTVLYAAPFHYSMLTRDTSAANLDSVRLAVSTTCSLSQEVAENFQQRFDRSLAQALGVIELGLVCVNVDDPIARWDSVGRPLPKFAVHIRHPNGDGFGEVVVSGPGIFDAYTEPWTPRDQLMPDGWFVTGDIGRIDSAGYLFLAGRKTSVINLAGKKVFPEEIESSLNRHPAVRESRVYGVAHPHFGEVVEAEVVLEGDATPEALRDFCRAELSAEKVPSQFHVVQCIAKTTATGKILRSATPSVA